MRGFFFLKSVGSGVIVDKTGIVVTNANVVHMASSVFVILNDGTSLKGQVMYENPQDDLAIIKVHVLKPLKEVALGKSGDIMVGEKAVVIGNPLGLENSVSVGINVAVVQNSQSIGFAVPVQNWTRIRSTSKSMNIPSRFPARVPGHKRNTGRRVRIKPAVFIRFYASSLSEDANSKTMTTDKQGDTLIIQMKKVK